MIKKVVCLIVMSLLVVLFATYINDVFQVFTHAYSTVTSWFSDIFSNSQIGTVLTQLIGLFLIPLLLTGLVAACYWFVKKKNLPAFNEVLWVLWVMLATLFVVGH